MEQLLPIAQPHGWMVPSAKGQPITPGRVNRVFHAACKAAGLPKMTPHRLRATYATWLSLQGVPIQDIQLALEHKDIATTAMYLGADIGRIAAAFSEVKDGGATGSLPTIAIPSDISEMIVSPKYCVMPFYILNECALDC